MEFVFLVRENEKRVEVARVTSDLEWSGDERVVELVKNVLKGRGLDPGKKKDFAQIPRVFSGSYFWAAEVEDAS